MKTNTFDDYIAEEIKKDPSLAKGLEEAGKIIDVSFRIYTIRKQKGFTQAQLAKKAGMHQSNIARLEDASLAHVPSTRTLSKISKALDIDIAELFTPPYKKEKNNSTQKINYIAKIKDKTTFQINNSENSQETVWLKSAIDSNLQYEY